MNKRLRNAADRALASLVAYDWCKARKLEPRQWPGGRGFAAIRAEDRWIGGGAGGLNWGEGVWGSSGGTSGSVGGDGGFGGSGKSVGREDVVGKVEATRGEGGFGGGGGDGGDGGVPGGGGGWYRGVAVWIESSSEVGKGFGKFAVVAAIACGRGRWGS